MHAGFQSNSVVQVETRAVAPPTGAEPVTHGTEYILFTKLLAAACPVCPETLHLL